MSLFHSKFDVVSVDNPLALAALAQVLELGNLGPASGLYSGAGTPNDFSGGTPLQGAVSLLPGTVVLIGPDGRALLADAPLLSAYDADHVPVLPWVTLDGNTDYSGKYVRKITVLQGGFTMVTDMISTDTKGDGSEAGTFVPGHPVTFLGGKVIPRSGASALRQIYGFVGPNGFDPAQGASF
jgi:hypothetical protein